LIHGRRLQELKQASLMIQMTPRNYWFAYTTNRAGEVTYSGYMIICHLCNESIIQRKAQHGECLFHVTPVMSSCT